jgi:uncharacterized protein YkwD
MGHGGEKDRRRPGSVYLACVTLPAGPLLALLLGTAQPSVPAQGALEAALREAVAASCPGAKIALDADLTRAAQRYGQAVREGRAQPGGADLAFFAGLETADPAPFAGVAVVEPPAEADRAVQDLFPRSCRFTHAGVAATALPGNRAVVAVLSSSRAVALTELPGRVAPGARVRVSGTLSPGLLRPRLYALRPGGEVEEKALALSRGRDFAENLVLRGRGEHAVEVLADGPGGPQVLALKRIFAGTEPPDAPPPAPKAREGLTFVEEAIASLRAARGLPRLTRDAALDALAEKHSQAMARSRTFAHVLPADGTMTDRLRQSGYAYRSAGENIGLAPDAVAAHEAVVSSPAHLANLLDPRHQRLGLGAMRGTSPDGVPVVYLTEILAAPVLGSRDPAGEVARVLAEERRKHRLPVLVRDESLDAIALAEVRALSLGGVPEIRRSGAAQRALDTNPGLRSAAVDLVVGTAPEEAKGSNNLRDAGWTRVGVGALYASSREYGPGRLWVLIVYGR